MNILTFDAETYFSSDYTLSKMTTEEYVRDPRFEIIGVGVKLNDDKPEWFSGNRDAIKRFLLSRGFEQAAVLGHNMAFDMAIASWVLDLKPKFILDTLSMARPIHGAVMSLSLAKLSEHYGIGTKGNDTVWGRGLNRADFTPEQLEMYGGYCALREDSDVNLTYRLFQKLLPFTSKRELALIDATIRMFTEPRLVLDRTMLEGHLAQVRAKKDELLAAIGGDPEEVKKTLMSNPKMAEMLRSLGVEPPTKISPTTGKEAYAFAKTDQAMTELLEHENPEVQALVAARLGVKTTIEETRTERLIGIAGRGRMPIPLKYCGAVTTWRWSGCLTGDTLVTILRVGSVFTCKLVDVRGDDLVWDGQEFVGHDGVVFSGIRRVIEYRGIVGTPDHPVQSRDTGRYCSLEEAKTRGVHLALGGTPDPTRVNQDVQRRRFVEGPCASDVLPVRGSEAVSGEGLASRHATSVHELRRENKNEERSAPDACNEGISQDCAGSITARDTGDDGRAVFAIAGVGERREAEVCKSEMQTVARLRREGDRVPVRATEHGDYMGVEEFGADSRRAYSGPNRQQRSLRTGESAVHDSSSSELEQETVQRSEVWPAAHEPCEATPGLHIRGVKEVYQDWVYGRTDPSDAETPWWEAPTFDIRNCGPRHCFVANGYIVHNSDKVNVQNFTRGGIIRNALTAPPGMAIVVGDSAQIELRVNHTLAGQTDSVAAFKAGQDLYCQTASALFHREVTKSKEDYGYRFIGKVSDLQLQYQCGAAKYKDTVRILSTAEVKRGKMKSVVVLSDEEAKETVDAWRRARSKIVENNWGSATRSLTAMYRGDKEYVGLGKLVWTWTGDGVCGFEMASGHRIRYHDLKQDDEGWSYHTNYGRKRIYAGKIVENLIQSISRHIIAEQWLAFQAWCDQNYPQWRVVLQVHDELVAVGPEDEAPAVAAGLERILSTAPSWWPDLCLGAETGYAKRYGEAKS